MPVIGFLRDTSLDDAAHLVAAFGQGLKEAGFIAGQNVAIEYRSAEDQAHRLPALVADLVRQQVVLIVGNTRSALAAKAATTPQGCQAGRPAGPETNQIRTVDQPENRRSARDHHRAIAT
jgi:ABC-type uncharacterized transport system substrate-binding protein